MKGSMNTGAITGVRQAGLVEKPAPSASGNFAVVKILSAPMCTEYKAYRAGSPSESLGHEAAGEVLEVAQPGAVKVGDRVVVMPQFPCGVCPLCMSGEYIHCRNTLNALEITGNVAGVATYAQYLIKQDWLLLPIPDDVSVEHAAMGCCGLGATFGAMELMGVDAFDTILITGMGPVGLGGVINAGYRGARVIAVESHPFRQALACKLGAAEVLDPGDGKIVDHIRDLTGGRGVDQGLDCSGVPQAQRLLIDSVRSKGQVSFVGEGGSVRIEVSDDMIRKGISLRGSWHYNLLDYPKILQVIRGSEGKLNQLITHTFPLNRVQEAWELQLTGECGKVILHPWET